MTEDQKIEFVARWICAGCGFSPDLMVDGLVPQIGPKGTRVLTEGTHPAWHCYRSEAMYAIAALKELQERTDLAL